MMFAISGPCGLLVGGDLGTWIGSVGTALAVGIAAVGYFRSVRDKETAQASRMSAWTQGLTTLVHKDQSYEPAGLHMVDLRTAHSESIGFNRTQRITVLRDTNLIHYRVENGSDEAFADVFCALTDEDGVEITSLGKHASLPPHHRIAGEANVATELVMKRGVASWQFRVEAIFTDALGRKWRRVTGSPLERLAPDYEHRWDAQERLRRESAVRRKARQVAKAEAEQGESEDDPGS